MLNNKTEIKYRWLWKEVSQPNGSQNPLFVVYRRLPWSAEKKSGSELKVLLKNTKQNSWTSKKKMKFSVKRINEVETVGKVCSTADPVTYSKFLCSEQSNLLLIVSVHALDTIFSWNLKTALLCDGYTPIIRLTQTRQGKQQEACNRKRLYNSLGTDLRQGRNGEIWWQLDISDRALRVKCNRGTKGIV